MSDVQADQQENSAAPAVSGAGESNTASDAVVSTAASTEQAATTSQPSPAPASEPSGEPSKQALVMRMHAALDELEAKLATGVHVFAHEVSALRAHIKAIL